MFGFFKSSIRILYGSMRVLGFKGFRSGFRGHLGSFGVIWDSGGWIRLGLGFGWQSPTLQSLNSEPYPNTGVLIARIRHSGYIAFKKGTPKWYYQVFRLLHRNLNLLTHVLTSTGLLNRPRGSRFFSLVAADMAWVGKQPRYQ